MKNIILMLSLLISLTACSQTQKGNVTIALCEKGKGCTEVLKKYDKNDIVRILQRSGLFASMDEPSILVVEKCDYRDEEKLTIPQLHTQYGGKGEAGKIADFDLEKYLQENRCLVCPNHTKKISFSGSGVSANGERYKGNGFFYLNIKVNEAYMPNEAFRQMGFMEGEGSSDISIDQFIRNNVVDTYTIVEGKKFHQVMDLGSQLGVQQEKLNEQRFKKDFRKTGKTRKYNGNDDVEYVGKDNEGRTISIWLSRSADVCLPVGQFDAVGFYNLGYLAVDRITYLITEMSSSDFHLKLTSVTDATYNFNPAGYKTMGNNF